MCTPQDINTGLHHPSHEGGGGMHNLLYVGALHVRGCNPSCTPLCTCSIIRKSIELNISLISVLFIIFSVEDCTFDNLYA